MSDVARATWTVNGLHIETLSDALKTYYRMLHGLDRFNAWAIAEDLPPTTLHAGIDCGVVLLGDNMVVGESITAASQFADAACRRNVTLVIGAELLSQFTPRCISSLKRERLDLKAVFQKERDVYYLTASAVRSLVSV